jgi:hypothetical protein
LPYLGECPFLGVAVAAGVSAGFWTVGAAGGLVPGDGAEGVRHLVEVFQRVDEAADGGGEVAGGEPVLMMSYLVFQLPVLGLEAGEFPAEATEVVHEGWGRFCAGVLNFSDPPWVLTEIQGPPKETLYPARRVKIKRDPS